MVNVKHISHKIEPKSIVNARINIANGETITNLPQHSRALLHIFDRVCVEKVIEHRLTLPAHPWKNGQVERMNKTIKDATVHANHPLNLKDTCRCSLTPIISRKG